MRVRKCRQNFHSWEKNQFKYLVLDVSFSETVQVLESLQMSECGIERDSECAAIQYSRTESHWSERVGHPSSGELTFCRILL